MVANQVFAQEEYKGPNRTIDHVNPAFPYYEFDKTMLANTPELIPIPSSEEPKKARVFAEALGRLMAEPVPSFVGEMGQVAYGVVKVLERLVEVHPEMAAYAMDNAKIMVTAWRKAGEQSIYVPLAKHFAQDERFSKIPSMVGYPDPSQKEPLVDYGLTASLMALAQTAKTSNPVKLLPKVQPIKTALDLCKERALGYLDQGNPKEALASFFSGLDSIPETRAQAWQLMGILKNAGELETPEQVRSFIVGFA